MSGQYKDPQYKKHYDERNKARRSAYNKVFYKEHYKQLRIAEQSASWKLKLIIIALLGGKCVRCGNSDPRVLQINHINGGRRQEIQKYKKTRGFYIAIRDGERDRDDLELLCANCNLIYEYEQRRMYRYINVAMGIPVKGWKK